LGTWKRNEKFRVVQDWAFESDFDREVKRVMGRKVKGLTSVIL